MASFTKAISPGQEGNVTLKISTHNKQGKVRQSATIYSNDPQKPTSKITLSGIIKPYVRILPSHRVSLTGYFGDKAEQTLSLTSLVDEPFTITDVSSSIDDKIKYDLKTEKKDKEYRLEIKTRSGIEEAFREFAYEWGYWNEDFKRSLYAIKSSTLERTTDGLNRALDKANDIILNGTRRQIEKFAASLSGPTTILFALGILLPMVIGAMLPMMSINVPTNPTELAGTETDEVEITDFLETERSIIP